MQPTFPSLPIAVRAGHTSIGATKRGCDPRVTAAAHTALISTSNSSAETDPQQYIYFNGVFFKQKPKIKTLAAHDTKQAIPRENYKSIRMFPKTLNKQKDSSTLNNTEERCAPEGERHDISSKPYPTR